MIPGSLVMGGGVGGDPYASSVKLYLKMNGSNGSTTFTDSSPSARAVTAGGNAQINTAQSLFEGQSGYFDGSGDYLSCADSADFEVGSGGFTVESFIWLDNTTGVKAIYSKGGNEGVTFGALSLAVSGSKLRAAINSSSSNATNELVLESASGTLVANRLHHVAFSRAGNNVYLAVDGVVAASGSWSLTVWNSATAAHIGITLVSSSPTGSPFKGYMDNFRFTNGVGRYTSDFDPFAQYWS